MIEVISLHKKFDQDYILNDINTVFEKGKTNLIIGQSGSGKTVLIKCLLGLYNINSGEISYDGIHSSEMDSNNKLELRREMGMVFQGSALFDSLNVLENVRFPLDMLTQLDIDEKNKRALKFIERVNLSDSLNKLPSELSGGMQKRVGLARAISNDPDIIFFDEPTTGLDPIMSDVINRLIRDCVDRLGATAVTITHDMASAQRIGDDIAMLQQGQIIWRGPAKLVRESGNEYVDQFVHGRAEGPITIPGGKN
ncbi:MAG TPA: ABC transporter ATP-binding protein [Alphaproteobacteria bacterium]|nr:ABC transporter ATP-binding protein [Alphaproteobacteria bacterium]